MSLGYAKKQVKKYMLWCGPQTTWVKKLRIYMNAFFTSQFQYCLLVWMFHSRTLDSRIKKLQEKTLRLVFNDSSYSFSQLSKKRTLFLFTIEISRNLLLKFME